MSHSLPIHGRVESVHRNRQHEESTANVSRMQQPRLGKTRARRRHNHVLVDPVEADQERRALLQIGNEQVQHQNHILVVAQKRPVVELPCHQAVADEADQRQSGANGKECEDADGDEAFLEVGRERVEAVGFGKVGGAVYVDAGSVGVGLGWKCRWDRHGCCGAADWVIEPRRGGDDSAFVLSRRSCDEVVVQVGLWAHNRDGGFAAVASSGSAG